MSEQKEFKIHPIRLLSRPIKRRGKQNGEARNIICKWR